MTESEIKILGDFMKLAKILVAFMVAVLVGMAGMVYLELENRNSINYLINDSLATKQTYIVEVAGKLDKVDPEAVRPQVETSLDYCTDTYIVHANGGDVTNECETLQTYYDTDYGE